MTDLMMLLFSVGILLAAGFALEASSSSAERTKLDHQLGIAQDELDKSRAQLEDWQLRSRDLETRVQRYDEMFGGTGVNPDELEKSLETLQSDLKLAQAKAASLQDEVSQREIEIAAMRRGISTFADMNGKLSASLRQEKQNVTRLDEQLTQHGGLEGLLKRIEQLEFDRKESEAQLESAKTQQSNLADDLRDAGAKASEFEAKANELEDAVVAYEQQAKAQRQIRQELLGIPGKLARVVMVVDRSQSMSEGNRWEDAKRTVAGWIEHLPVEAAALVVFGADVQVVPERFEPPRDALYNSIDVPSIDAEIRVEMVQALSEVSPAGLTPTAKALRQAMKFRDVDAIILFTDGAPEQNAGSVLDATTEVFELVESWSRDNPNSCVHTVGIGNYFERRMRDFLLGVAKRGRGAFIGR
jgi:Mg-chelatase subunit ChlD